MSCLNKTENIKFQVLLDQLRREIKELSETTDARLLMIEKHHAELCVYIRENLSNAIIKQLDTMLASGELEQIIKDVLFDEVNDLQIKIDDFVNVKLFGAIGDGVADDTNALQDALTYGYHNKKIVYVPAGTYKITQALKMYEHQQLIGNSRQHTVIKRVGDVLEKGLDYSAAIMLVRSDDYVFEYTEGQKIRNIAIECEGHDYGIYLTTSCPYLEIDNVNINEAKVGIYVTKGSWLSKLSNINIWKCNTGIKYRASGTSTKLENIYVMYATDVAYDIEGLSYSDWENVCADWCTGTVYKFSFCTININGLGCECIEADNAVNVNNARIYINAGYIFSLVKETAKYIIGNASDLTFVNSNLGGNAESKAKFCEAGLAFDLEIKHCKLNGIDAESTTGSAVNVTKFDSGKSLYLTSLHEKLSFIGASNNEDSNIAGLGYDIPMFAMYGNVMGHPYYGKGIANNREWHTVKKAGDIFVNQAPQNGIAFYQQLTDTDYHYSTGRILAIDGNTLTVSSMNIGIAAEKRNTVISTEGKLYNEDKIGVNITAVDYDTNTITVDDASEFKVGEGFYFKLENTFMRDAKYASVQHIAVGTKDERPADAPIGFMYFDVNVMKPIWRTSTRWIDATGAEV